MLAVIGSIPDTWGPLPPALLAERLKGVARLERATVEDAGHFIHMEQPARTAELVLEYTQRNGAGFPSSGRQSS